MPEQKQINLPKFEILPSGKYAGCTCKRPYNLLSIAILLLDPAAPGYFLNIPPNNRLYYRNTSQSIIKEPLLGRGCEEVTFQEIYFLIVAILKIVTLFLLFEYLIADSSDVDLKTLIFLLEAKIRC